MSRYAESGQQGRPWDGEHDRQPEAPEGDAALPLSKDTLRRVVHKLQNMSDTLLEIEDWLEDRDRRVAPWVEPETAGDEFAGASCLQRPTLSADGIEGVLLREGAPGTR